MKRHILARCCGPRVFAPLVLGAMVVGAAAPAWAIDEEVLLTTAEQACLSGNYQRGVEILANLYLATRKPAYLHNQARCYEQNGQNEAAIGRYNEFLRQAKNLPVEKKAELEANVARLEQKIARQHIQNINDGQPPYYGQQPPAYATPTPAQPPAQQPPVPQGPSTYQPYQQPAPAAPDTLAPATVTSAAGPDRGSKGLRIAGIITAAAGGGALLLGTLSGLAANDAKTKTEDDVKAMNPYDDKRYQNGKDSAKLATVGFIAAPVLLGAGALMYWLGTPSGSAEKAAYTVMPSVALGDGGAKVHLSLTY
jgi:hypothetical protein